MAPKTTSRAGTRRSSRRAGFTLMELIVVLLVIAVAMGIVAPSLRGFARSQSDADAAQNVLALAHLARNQAATMGTVSKLNFDIESNACWVTVQEAGAFVPLSSELGMPVELPKEMIVRIELPENQEPRDYVQFQPDGRAEQAMISLIGREGKTWRVVCPSATDRFRILKPGEEP